MARHIDEDDIRTALGMDANGNYLPDDRELTAEEIVQLAHPSNRSN